MSRSSCSKMWLGLLLSCLVLVGCGSQAPTRKAKVLLVAMDGLEPRLVDRFLAEGRLPTFEALLARSSRARIDCQVGTSSPVVWTTVATGLAPEEHGITGFTIDDVPVNSSHRRRPAFWNILPAQGIATATLGWLATWPVEDDSGILVSDRAYWSNLTFGLRLKSLVDFASYKFGGDAAHEIVPRFTPYPYDPDYSLLPQDDPGYRVNFLLHRRLVNVYLRDTIFAEITRDVTRSYDLDVLAVYFRGADYVGHGFWQYFEPQPFLEAGWEIDPGEIAALEGIIPAYYSYLDDLLGFLLQQVDKEALIMLLSDHGFRADPGYRTRGHKDPYLALLSGNHRDKAFLILAGPDVRSRVTQGRRLTHFDILPTLLYYLELPLARDLPGKPLLEYLDRDLVARRPLHFVETYRGNLDAARQAVRGEDDEKVLEELRSLGYLQ